MFHPPKAVRGIPLCQAELRRGDIVLLRFPIAEVPHEGDEAATPKLRPCLVLEVYERLGRRTASIAYGTSAQTRANRGYSIIAATKSGMETAGLDRPTRFVGLRRITVGLDQSGFEPAEGTASPIIGCLDADLCERMNAVHARIQAEADIAREMRRERREKQRRWQQEERDFLERNRALQAASQKNKGHAHD
ncbi:type II toxin-antitoxin system PemK/MazF family toxin [Maritimibacter alkaliphilus]|uniref:type II toxin-antitoxin system PemK/MazF family toxin n=1 Tax=Maritimibacter alkaliphilus TaxID=404236 RepID=UPI001C94FA4D|nr:type II toxin-antitoxin system PemK/MazF family toxin [Maritimibacter alkaliphilus]MBY6091776.1 type II toxin-antitoxin system PemK/MazF family toxin [Maritimibacter alkaliphilus]